MNLTDLNIEQLEKLMEEMANAPREEYGKRQPGERCAYEMYNREGHRQSTMGTEVSTAIRKKT